jgi:SIR2-like domain
VQISELPDYAILQQVARALWKQGKTRGAAVLVGAGFSRNAQLLHADGHYPPLWSELADEMQRRLEGTVRDCRDPLRIAEEFKVVLGEPALEGLIRDLVTDEEWAPGRLHRRLVELPWVDILTTNWDTLLERAAAPLIGQTYEVVRSLEDIATTRAPRIVKLHGSLPSNRPFILSEEDYRTYPRLFAPFVNLVQQVLLENELCLVGFSGDDPNFLSWTGWIRDQLGVAARKMYLVGAMDLTPAQRRLLELRNISAIDFQPILTTGQRNDRHRLAAETFLDFLEKSRPRAAWAWPEKDSPRSTAFDSDPQVQAKNLAALLSPWSIQRRSYPGWAVCPEEVVVHMKHATLSPEFNKASLQHLSLPVRCQLFFELAWRLDIAMLSVPDSLQEEMGISASQSDGWHHESERRFVQLFILKRARESGRDSAGELLRALQADSCLEADVKAAIAYEACLRSKSQLDFEAVQRGLTDLEGDDPLWKLRRAALLCWLGQLSDAESAVDEAISELREKFARNRNSLWVMSRLAWAYFVKKQYREVRNPALGTEPTGFDDMDGLQIRISESKCDPWEVFRALERKTDLDIETFEKHRQTIETTFDAGSYRERSKDIHINFGGGSALLAWEMLSDHVGLPARIENLDVLVSRMERAERIIEPDLIEDFQRILNLIQEGAEKTLKRRFSRLQVAVLDEDIFSWVLQTTMRSLDNAIPRIAHEAGLFGGSWTSRAALYIELLSRLVIRVDRQQALDVWRRGLGIARMDRSPSPLFEPLSNLMKRSMSAVPPEDRAALLTNALEFPLPDEKGLNSHFARHWPVAAEWFSISELKRPEGNTAFSARLQVLIEKVRTTSEETRGRAALWLVRLNEAGALTPDESAAFGDALWSRRDSEVGFPAATSLRPFLYLSIPGNTNNDTLEMITRRSSYIEDLEYFLAVSQTARKRHRGGAVQAYTVDVALESLREVLRWSPRRVPEFDIGNVSGKNRAVSEILGAYVANAVMPVLSPGDLTDEVVQAMLKKLGAVPSLVQALPQLLRLEPYRVIDVSMAILRAMTSRDSQEAFFGFNALYRWIELVKEKCLDDFPERLADGVISNIEMRREPGLLHALNLARFLLDAGLLSEINRKRVADVMGIVNVESAYDTASLNEEPTITLIREASTKLAQSLKRAGTENTDIEAWIASSSSDPMPEVRFALAATSEAT